MSVIIHDNKNDKVVHVGEYDGYPIPKLLDKVTPESRQRKKEWYKKEIKLSHK